MATESTIYERVIEHLKAGGSIQICTMTRATEYKPKHIAMIRPGKAGESGFYVQSGRSWNYVLPGGCAVRFSVLKSR
jgi:hypothetical protein